MKKEYKKPIMRVVLLRQPCQLLAGSGERGIPGYDDDYGYMPGVVGDGTKHLT